jgi:hypothetical protein
MRRGRTDTRVISSRANKVGGDKINHGRTERRKLREGQTRSGCQVTMAVHERKKRMEQTGKRKKLQTK